MQKISKPAVNRTATSKQVAISELRNSGVTRDILVLRKGDKIEIPVELDPRVDMFTPKGTDKPTPYYTITVEINSVPTDVSMASFRRTKSAMDEDLDECFNNQIVRTLHNLGDDEQRAAYLQGKTLVVDEIHVCKDRFREGKTVRVPLWRLAE